MGLQDLWTIVSAALNPGLDPSHTSASHSLNSPHHSRRSDAPDRAAKPSDPTMSWDYSPVPSRSFPGTPFGVGQSFSPQTFIGHPARAECRAAWLLGKVKKMLVLPSGENTLPPQTPRELLTTSSKELRLRTRGVTGSQTGWALSEKSS